MQRRAYIPKTFFVYRYMDLYITGESRGEGSYNRQIIILLNETRTNYSRLVL